jgi:acetyltransferase-like isoleucine patch superfamily enzyme
VAKCPVRDAYAPIVRSVRRLTGVIFLCGYRFLRRGWAKSFSVASSGAFASFGAHTVIEPPVRLDGEQRIAVGSGVYIGAGSWLQTHPPADGVTLEIGDGTSIAGNCVLSAVSNVKLGCRVLLARGVYISDHSHAFGHPTNAVLDQGVDRVGGVEIADGAWIGENAVICPGVRIGRGAVVGANSVVLESVPDNAVAVGAPARVVRRHGTRAALAATAS